MRSVPCHAEEAVRSQMMRLGSNHMNEGTEGELQMERMDVGCATTKMGEPIIPQESKLVL